MRETGRRMKREKRRSNKCLKGIAMTAEHAKLRRNRIMNGK
jgi:hypothetical protein